MSGIGYRGQKALEARDEADALEFAKANRPSLTITSIIMPGMDGYNPVAKNRGDPALSQKPVASHVVRPGKWPRPNSLRRS